MPKFRKGEKPSTRFAAIQRAGAEEAMARRKKERPIERTPLPNFREKIARLREQRESSDDPLFPVAGATISADRHPNAAENESDAQ